MSAPTHPATTTPLAYTIAEAAHACGVSPSLIRAAINDPAYPYPLNARRIGAKGGAVRIEADELKSWLKAHPEGDAR